MKVPNPEVAVPASLKPTPEEVGIQLDRLLTSPLFRSSQRCQILLRYIVEHTVARDMAALKERSLGADVFGRPPDYDTNADPVVRGAAGEIRKKLAQYYQEPAHHGELRIELHPRSYVPEFHSVDTPSASDEALLVAKPGPWKRGVWIAGAAAVLLVATAALLLNRVQITELEKFWRPMLDAPGGVLICLGQPRVYNFRSDARQQEIEKWLDGMPAASVAALKDPIPMGQLVPMWDRYVALGDTLCLVRLTSFFEKRSKPYRIRGQTSITFADLRESPSILIGAFNNEWTLRAIGQMRYTFDKDYQGLEVVRDREHPEKKDWKLVNSWPYWDIAEDYAIVSRVLDRSTDRMAVVAAGITHFGTEGAGEFLSDPRYFAEAVSGLPADWTKRNLQIVLRVPVVRRASGHPVVLATHVW